MFSTQQLVIHSLNVCFIGYKIRRLNSEFPRIILIGSLRKYWPRTDWGPRQRKSFLGSWFSIPGGSLEMLDIETSNKTKRKENSVGTWIDWTSNGLFPPACVPGCVGCLCLHSPHPSYHCRLGRSLIVYLW